MGVQSSVQSFTLYIILCFSIYHATTVDTGKLISLNAKQLFTMAY